MTEQSPVEAIFFAALEKRTAEERDAYLDAACGGDQNLRQRVERLLAAHPQVGSFLEPHHETSAYAGPSESVGAIVDGKYKLLESLGEGGMGAVFMAQQTAPVKRLVALKLIKLGMDSRQVLARFEAERQALALMDHPNIAKVLDAGTTDSGRPFFVMELVKGVPITRFCDERQLSPRERLELFIPVCHAIQHAHQKGVIHRDIKPTNVLVALYDDRPVPKVIDFGVAKAAGSQLTDASLVTGFGAIVGTPEYMSPEQAQLNQLDIDTRSDVYALGVLLYELLTGTTPIDRKRLSRDAVLEVLRVIREEEPSPPSTRLSTSEALASIAASRKTEPSKLARLMRGELDWIVMKCLEKERSRRYETANALARDLECYLHDEVVEARPPSAGYRLRKFMRKHRVAIGTAAAFAVLLIAAAGVSGWLAVKARRAERAAQEVLIEAQLSADKAQASATEAENYAKSFWKLADSTADSWVEAEVRGLGLQVDLDLSEFRTDLRTGLLRLARPLKQSIGPMTQIVPNGMLMINEFEREGHPMKATAQIPPGGKMEWFAQLGGSSDYKALREFVTTAVLATGQEFAPLLPPITHDGQAITHDEQGVASATLSPDKQTLLTLGEDYTARLWDTRTARQIALLRKGNERVVNCGFSPDGRTVFTDDPVSVARFWDVPSGQFRAATDARPNRYVVPDKENVLGMGRRDASVLGQGRLLTRKGVVGLGPFGGSSTHWEGPCELWDTATGRLVAQLKMQDADAKELQFFGKWLIARMQGAVLVFSAEDGRLLANLTHPAGETVERMDVSPTGRRLATLSGKPSRNSAGPVGWDSLSLRVWDVETGKIQASTTLPGNKALPFEFRYWMDDPSGGSGSLVAWGWDDGWLIYRVGQTEHIVVFPDSAAWTGSLTRLGDLAHGGNGCVYDVRTWRRLLPPARRKFHPDLARFAPDGRFVSTALSQGLVLIDTRTDKLLPTPNDTWHILPTLGMIAVKTDALGGSSIRLIPPASKLDLPPELLELWAQVAVRGELDAEGRFAKWDEPTWEKKRQQLAAKPAPYSDFPFPGHVAADRLHWLRQEYLAATEADKLRLAKQLLDRAVAAGDTAEAVRWRARVAPKPAATKPADAKPNEP